MAREFAEKFYHSGAWKRCRESYIEHRVSIDGGMCETCHERLGKIVHHKIWLNESNINDPEITLSYKNLKFDCQICHNREEDERKMGVKHSSRENQYFFDSEGQIVPLPPVEAV